MGMVKHFRELEVYQGSMELVMRVFEFSKALPPDERYGLSDQIRRSSRSVCANLAEAWRKRQYRGSFIAKRTGAAAEAAETQVHLEIAFRNRYLKRHEFVTMDDAYEKVIAQLVNMIDQAPRWALKPNKAPGTTATRA
jgi:four helix bundle protein